MAVQFVLEHGATWMQEMSITRLRCILCWRMGISGSRDYFLITERIRTFKIREIAGMTAQVVGCHEYGFVMLQQTFI
jgi:hypothetical protein